MDTFDKLMSGPHLTGPKRQHFVPKFYLEGFTHLGVLNVFDRTDGAMRSQLPKDTNVVGHLYTFQDNHDRRRYDLEAMFCYYEGKAAPIIRKLAQRERIDIDEREYLTAFIALAAVRTPAAIAEAQNVHAGFVKARSTLLLSDEKEVLTALRKMEGPDADETTLRKHAHDVAKMVRDDAFTVDVDPAFALGKSLRLFDVIAKSLFTRDWMALYSPSEEHSFLTTDSPVILTPTCSSVRHSPIGYGSPHAQILFPLTHDSALVISGDQGRSGRADISVEELRRLNLAVAGDCHRYVIGRDAALVSSITDELKLAGTTWQPKYEVEVGHRFEPDGSGVSAGAWVQRTG